MKKNITLTFTFLLLFLCKNFAQNVSYKMLEQERLIGGFSTTLPSDEKSMIKIIQCQKKTEVNGLNNIKEGDIAIVKYDSTLKQTKAILQSNFGDFKYYRVLEFENNFHLIFINDKNDSTKYYSLEFSKKTLATDNQYKYLFGFPLLNFSKMKHYFNNYKATIDVELEYEFNKDKSAVIFIAQQLTSKEKATYHLNTFDSKLNKLWSKDFTFETDDKMNEIKQLYLADDNNLVILNETKNKKEDTKYFYQLLQISRDKKIYTTNINIDNREVESINIVHSYNNYVKIFGVCNNETNKFRNCYFQNNYDLNTNKLGNYLVEKFPSDFIEKDSNFSSNVNYKKTYYFNDYIQIVFENGAHNTSYHYSNHNRLSASSYDYYSNILVYKIDKTNKVTISKIPRFSYTNSFTSFEYNKNLYFVYCDYIPKWLTAYRVVKEEYCKNNDDGSCVIVAKLDENGKLTRTGVFSSKEMDGLEFRDYLTKCIKPNRLYFSLMSLHLIGKNKIKTGYIDID